MNLSDFSAIIGVICGVAGATTGGISLWHTMSLKRIQLHVKGEASMARNPGMWEYAISITNLSAFPVTVNEVGIKQSDSGMVPFSKEFCTEKYSIPCRLESRDSFTTVMTAENAKGQLTEHWPLLAYAKTACNNTFYGECVLYELLKPITPPKI